MSTLCSAQLKMNLSFFCPQSQNDKMICLQPLFYDHRIAALDEEFLFNVYPISLKGVDALSEKTALSKMFWSFPFEKRHSLKVIKIAPVLLEGKQMAVIKVSLLKNGRISSRIRVQLTGSTCHHS